MIVPVIYMEPKSMIVQDNLQGACMGYCKGNGTSGGLRKTGFGKHLKVFWFHYRDAAK